MSATALDPESSLSSSGYEDGLGRRVLDFDRETGTMLERLVLRPELGAFEIALRERMAIVAALEDERFARPRELDRDADNHLTVVSDYVAGRRLCDVLDAAAEHGIVGGLDAGLGLLLELLPAIARLHDAGLAHGAIAPGRVIVTPERQIVLLDAIYAEPLERLQLTRRRLWSELRLAFPPTAGVVRFDRTADLSHALMVAVSVVLGRPLRDDDYPNGITALRQEILEIASIRGSKSFAESVDKFFVGALPLAGKRTTMSADEAASDLRKLIRKELGITTCRAALVEFFQQVETADIERVVAEALAGETRPNPETERADAERHERERLERDARGRADEERRQRERLEREAREQEGKAARERAEAEERERARAEEQRAERERVEKARLEAERAEADRLEHARIEAERAERERLEQERLARERAEAEKRERLERERLERERAERERLEAEHRERERLERERLEKERLEAERLEKEAKARAEKARLEAERLEREARERAEKARLEAERLERERLERERLEKEARERAEKARREAERLEQQARERAEKARLEAERLEHERLEAERRERERIEKETRDRLKREAERAERERLEKEALDRAEHARNEADRLERERVEAAKRERKRVEAQRLEDERREQQEQARAAAARAQAERAARERADAERADAERAEAERAEAERRTAAASAARGTKKSGGWLVPPERAAAFEPPLRQSPPPAPPRPYPVYTPPAEPPRWRSDEASAEPMRDARPAVPSYTAPAAPPVSSAPSPIRLKQTISIAPDAASRAENRQEPDAMSAEGAYEPFRTIQEDRPLPWKLIAAGVVLIAITFAIMEGYSPASAPVLQTVRKVVPSQAAKQAAAGPAPVAAGQIAITTEPAGLKILLDGKAAGESPLTLNNIAAGRHVLTLIGDGGSLKRTVRVEPGRGLAINVPVFSGFAMVSAPFVVQIAEHGKGLGTSEDQVILGPGRHELSLSNADLTYNSTETVEVTPGEVTRVSIDPRGRANINAAPWAEVWIDGEKAGETPLANVPIRLGVREIVFKNPQFPDRKVVTTIKAGAPASIAVDFSKDHSPLQ